MSEVKTPWKDYVGDVPMHLDYFKGSMFDAVARIAEEYPNNIAFDFMGRSTTYRKMVQEIEKCAKSLKTLGVRPGDKITIAMPNCPQAIYMFYAVNLVGGIANMIHPLSAEKEIEFYLNESQSTTAITLDQFYDKFEHIRQNTGIINIIIASVKDALSRTIRAGYMLTEGRKIQKIPDDAPVIRWREFMDMSRFLLLQELPRNGAMTIPPSFSFRRHHRHHWRIVLTNGTSTPWHSRDHRHQPYSPARRPDAGRHAPVPRLRPGVRSPSAGQRRPLHPDPPLFHRQELTPQIVI